MPKIKVLKTNKVSEGTNSISLDDQSPKSVLEKHSYLKQILVIDPNDVKRFICKVCTENQPEKKTKPKESVEGHIYWIKMHLDTKTHRDYTPHSEKPQLEEAIAALGRQKHPNKFSSNSEQQKPTSDENIDIIEEQNQVTDTKSNLLPLSKASEAKLHLDISYFIVANHLLMIRPLSSWIFANT